MVHIFVRDKVLMYYGNPAGYLSDGKVILDPLFEKEEVLRYIEEKQQADVEVREGVYDRLSEGGDVQSKDYQGERRLRIYQLRQDSPIMMRFISLAERKRRGYGKPQMEDYVLTYEKEIDRFDLEGVWEQFGRGLPDGFEGHALSISDVVAFLEGGKRRYFYVEPSGFAEIEMEGAEKK